MVPVVKYIPGLSPGGGLGGLQPPLPPRMDGLVLTKIARLFPTPKEEEKATFQKNM